MSVTNAPANLARLAPARRLRWPSLVKPALQLLHLLRRPPAVPPVYQAFNQLRQVYVLAQAVQVFARRADDPAALFGKQLLDAGCGESTIAQFLALAGAEITALDPNAQALEFARAAAEDFGAPVTFLHNRVESLLTQPSKYDVVLAFDLLEEVEDPARMVWVLRQLLAPGGMLVFSAIDRKPLAWLLHICLSCWFYHRRRPGVGSLKHLWQRFVVPASLQQFATEQGLALFNFQRLRFSLSRQQWILSDNERRGTRYLMTFTAPAA